jgi:RNA polymerase sigma factor (sigma-70 family)
VRSPPLVPPQDPEAATWFATHLQPHEPMLRAWLQSRFPQFSPNDIDDIVQDAYTRILKTRATVELKSPKAFFFAVARNLAYDHFRKFPVSRQVNTGVVEDLNVLDDSVDIFETVSRNQEIELMAEAVQSLPDRCRQVLTLRFVYGMANRDIASQLNIAVKTVEVQVTAGIKRCTEFIAKRKGGKS